MPEFEEKTQPTVGERDLKTELVSHSGSLEITYMIYVDINVAEEDGAKQIVDSETKPREDNLIEEGVLVDKLNIDALRQFFQKVNVHFTGDPSTTVDQEDFLGYISISCSDMNTALRTGKLVLKKKEGSDTYEFEGLEKFLDEFTSEHAGDDKYREDNETETE